MGEKMKIKTGHKKIRVYGESVDLAYCTLEDALSVIKGLIKSYGKDAVIDWTYPSYFNTKHLAVFYKREETDMELDTRLLQETNIHNINEARDKAEFVRLQAKFQE